MKHVITIVMLLILVSCSKDTTKQSKKPDPKATEKSADGKKPDKIELKDPTQPSTEDSENKDKEEEDKKDDASATKTPEGETVKKDDPAPTPSPSLEQQRIKHNQEVDQQDQRNIDALKQMEPAVLLKNEDVGHLSLDRVLPTKNKNDVRDFGKTSLSWVELQPVFDKLEQEVVRFSRIGKEHYTPEDLQQAQDYLDFLTSLEDKATGKHKQEVVDRVTKLVEDFEALEGLMDGIASSSGEGAAEEDIPQEGKVVQEGTSPDLVLEKRTEQIQENGQAQPTGEDANTTELIGPPPAPVKGSESEATVSEQAVEVETPKQGEEAVSATEISTEDAKQPAEITSEDANTTELIGPPPAPVKDSESETTVSEQAVEVETPKQGEEVVSATEISTEDAKGPEKTTDEDKGPVVPDAKPDEPVPAFPRQILEQVNKSLTSPLVSQDNAPIDRKNFIPSLKSQFERNLVKNPGKLASDLEKYKKELQTLENSGDLKAQLSATEKSLKDVQAKINRDRKIKDPTLAAQKRNLEGKRDQLLYLQNGGTSKDFDEAIALGNAAALLQKQDGKGAAQFVSEQASKTNEEVQSEIDAKANEQVELEEKIKQENFELSELEKDPKANADAIKAKKKEVKALEEQKSIVEAKKQVLETLAPELQTEEVQPAPVSEKIIATDPETPNTPEAFSPLLQSKIAQHADSRAFETRMDQIGVDPLGKDSLLPAVAFLAKNGDVKEKALLGGTLTANKGLVDYQKDLQKLQETNPSPVLLGSLKAKNEEKITELESEVQSLDPKHLVQGPKRGAKIKKINELIEQNDQIDYLLGGGKPADFDPAISFLKSYTQLSDEDQKALFDQIEDQGLEATLADVERKKAITDGALTGHQETFEADKEKRRDEIEESDKSGVGKWIAKTWDKTKSLATKEPIEKDIKKLEEEQKRYQDQMDTLKTLQKAGVEDVLVGEQDAKTISQFEEAIATAVESSDPVEASAEIRTQKENIEQSAMSDEKKKLLLEKLDAGEAKIQEKASEDVAVTRKEFEELKEAILAKYRSEEGGIEDAEIWKKLQENPEDASKEIDQLDENMTKLLKNLRVQAHVETDPAKLKELKDTMQSLFVDNHGHVLITDKEAKEIFDEANALVDAKIQRSQGTQLASEIGPVRKGDVIVDEPVVEKTTPEVVDSVNAETVDSAIETEKLDPRVKQVQEEIEALKKNVEAVEILATHAKDPSALTEEQKEKAENGSMPKTLQHIFMGYTESELCDNVEDGLKIIDQVRDNPEELEKLNQELESLKQSQEEMIQAKQSSIDEMATDHGRSMSLIQNIDDIVSKVLGSTNPQTLTKNQAEAMVFDILQQYAKLNPWVKAEQKTYAYADGSGSEKITQLVLPDVELMEKNKVQYQNGGLNYLVAKLRYEFKAVTDQLSPGDTFPMLYIMNPNMDTQSTQYRNLVTRVLNATRTNLDGLPLNVSQSVEKSPGIVFFTRINEGAVQ